MCSRFVSTIIEALNQPENLVSIQNLIEQRKQIEDQIAAAKAEAVAGILGQIKALELTWADFGVEPIRSAKPAAVKRPPKFRDDKGNTWTGTGKRPTWLQTALQNGADLEQFRIKLAE